MFSILFLKIKLQDNEEMAQQLRVCSAWTECQSLVPSTHNKQSLVTLPPGNLITFLASTGIFTYLHIPLLTFN